MRNCSIKRGETLLITLACADAAGNAFDLGAVSITSHVRDARGVLIAELTFAADETTPGTATLSATDTAGWPLGLLKADIRISDGQSQGITRTFGVEVLASVTYDDPALAPYDPVTS